MPLSLKLGKSDQISEFVQITEKLTQMWPHDTAALMLENHYTVG